MRKTTPHSVKFVYAPENPTTVYVMTDDETKLLVTINDLDNHDPLITFHSSFAQSSIQMVLERIPHLQITMKKKKLEPVLSEQTLRLGKECPFFEPKREAP